MSRTLAFGQPLGAVMQVAYTVADLQTALTHWVHGLRVGPFFVFDDLAIEDERYYGRPSDAKLSVALAYSGSLCIELVQQTNDAPSVFRDAIRARGYGFHHWALSTDDLDADVARYEALGARVAFSGRVTIGGRFAYLDTTERLGGMVELIEIDGRVEGLFANLKSVAEAWDGCDPVRRPG
jgi:hypothetical protein